MDVKYINPFLSVTKDILEKLTGIKLYKGNIFAKSNNIPMNNIVMGNVATRFSKQKIARNITPPTIIIGENI